MSHASARPGVAGLVVVSAGFAETGPEGAARQAELLRICRTGGMRLVGPNCLGIVNTACRAQRQFPAPIAPLPGAVALMSQSGAVAAGLVARARPRSVGSPPSSRSATRPTSAATTCSSTGRTTRGTDVDRSVPGVVRQPAQVRPHRPPGVAPQADRRGQERPHGRRRCGPCARTPPPRPPRTSPSTRCSRQAGVIRVDTHRGAAGHRAGCWPPSRCPPGRRVAIVGNSGGPQASWPPTPASGRPGRARAVARHPAAMRCSAAAPAAALAQPGRPDRRRRSAEEIGVRRPSPRWKTR